MTANTGIAPPDFSTAVGQVRLLVGDTDASDIAEGSGIYHWFSDDEVSAMIDLYNGSVKRAAIWILSQVAVSQSLLLKSWTSEDLAVRGDLITAAIEKTIARLAAEVQAEESLDDEDFELYPRGGARPRFPEASMRWPWIINWDQ